MKKATAINCKLLSFFPVDLDNILENVRCKCQCCVKKTIFCHCDPLSGLLHSNCCWKCRKAVKSLAGTFYGWSSILTKLGQWLPDTILGRHVLPNIFSRWIVGQTFFKDSEIEKIILAPDFWWQGKWWHPGGEIGQLCELATSWFVANLAFASTARQFLTNIRILAS